MISPCLSGTLDHGLRPIDFIVTDEQAARWADAASVRIVDFEAADKPDRAQISDHCPVVLDLFVQTTTGCKRPARRSSLSQVLEVEAARRRGGGRP